MMQDPPTFEISKLKSNTLTLRKKNGTWEYVLSKDEEQRHLYKEKRAHMEEAQEQNWETLGLAVMGRKGEKGLKLIEIRI